jgi:hypothetical protein
MERRLDEHESRFDALFACLDQNYRDAGEQTPAMIRGELPRERRRAARRLSAVPAAPEVQTGA